MVLLLLLLTSLLFYITIILDIGRVHNEASVGHLQQAHPVSTPHLTLVQQKIPSKLEVYVI
jgi:hypothetical protein